MTAAAIDPSVAHVMAKLDLTPHVELRQALVVDCVSWYLPYWLRYLLNVELTIFCFSSTYPTRPSRSSG
jgi:hypothetical protein